MTQPDLSDFKLARQYMADAYLAIEAGKFNMEHFPNVTINRAYYSIFYACHAALALLGLHPSSHEGVHNMISKEYVRNGALSKEIPSTLASLGQRRIKTDYLPQESYKPEEARHFLDRAISAVNQIRDHLVKGISRKKSR
jgi:uncharacterized protein (UPF0332 family)